MISKKTIKKWPFFAVDPTTSLFQFFFVVLLYHSNRSRSDNQIFHWEKQTFFQLLSVLTMSPRRRCNLTSPLDFGKAETPVFHGVKRCQKRRSFHQKIGQTFWKMSKKWSAKSFLNPHSKGFCAIPQSDSNRALKTENFQLGTSPKRPTDDRFMKILVFLAILVTFYVTFFVKKRISSCRTRWNKLKTTDLEKSMRTDLGKKRFDCRSSKWRKDFAQKCKFGTGFFFNPWFYMEKQ